MIHTRSPRQAAIAEQMALLCLNAPLTDGQLKLPSSMHLGAQIANDHPIMEMRRQSDANRLVEKSRSQRGEALIRAALQVQSIVVLTIGSYRPILLKKSVRLSGLNIDW
jgi:hypothetical protein